MLTRLLLAALWLILGTATAWAPGSLTLFLAEHLGVTREVGATLTWGLIGVELGLGLGLILSTFARWLRPLGLVSLFLSAVFLALVLLVDDARTCSCFGVLGGRPFLSKLVILGVLLYLSALVAWPKPPRLPSGRTEGFTDVIRRAPGPGPDLATPSGPGTIARSPETATNQVAPLDGDGVREHTPR